MATSACLRLWLPLGNVLLLIAIVETVCECNVQCYLKQQNADSCYNTLNQNSYACLFSVLFRYNKNVSFSCSFSDGDFNLGRSDTKRNERCWNFHLPGPYYALRGHLRVLQYNHHTRIFVFSL